MRIQVETRRYNDRRYGKPWIARVTAWKGSQPDIEWGAWVGRDGTAGRLEIDAAAGDIVRHGQKDHRKASGTTVNYYQVQADGSLVEMSPTEALDAWRARGASEPASPLAAYRTDDLLAELARRGEVPR